MKKSTGRTLAALGATAVLVLAAPLAASAHVTINPDEVAAGSYETVDVRVPNESDTASTVSVVLSLPTDTPFLYVGYQPVPGWSIEVTTATLPEPVDVEGTEVTEAPTTVTFTADAGGIAPGQFQEFPLVIGPIPDGVDEIVLPAVQTYDDGEVAAWTATPDEVAADDTLLPAPVIAVTAGTGGDGHSDAGHGDMAAPDADGASTTRAAGTSGGAATGAALGLGISGLVLGAIGAIAGVVALLRTRRAS